MLADRELGRAADGAGYRVAPKVRLAAVLPIMAGQDLAVDREIIDRIRAEHAASAGWHMVGLVHEAWA